MDAKDAAHEMGQPIRQRTPFGYFLDLHGVKQAEVARALGVSEATISRVAAGEHGLSHANIETLLTWLEQRMGRRVSYQEAFMGEAA